LYTINEFIVLNANPPVARYAGMLVYDTGSAATASLEWDGNNDNWIIVEETGQSALLLTGPTGSKGSEVAPTVNTLLKGTGHHTVGNSNVSDNGIQVSIATPLVVTGSITATSLVGTASFAVSASRAITAETSVTASHVVQAISASYALSASRAETAGTATTASYVLNAISSSYSLSSSNANTASYVLNAVSASFATTASHVTGTVTSASYALSSSFSLTASFFAGTVTSASFASTASFINRLNQAVVITGSVQGNVVSASISSATASLDFSTSNFFTSLASGSTFYNITNPQIGQTVNLLITTAGVASASFSSNVRQVSGSRYAPTSGSAKNDVITFISWDGSTVYLANVKNLI